MRKIHQLNLLANNVQCTLYIITTTNYILLYDSLSGVALTAKSQHEVKELKRKIIIEGFHDKQQSLNPQFRGSKH